ncbi:DMT family transporter [Cardiobacteriaceae bacterium TAE3-ERU3]|nr:DMT family transporter [Cardiobacteriaceae bacterium TAE3-ERU3]
MLLLITGCVLFGLGSLIVAFVDVGAYAIAFWRLAIAAGVFGIIAVQQRAAMPTSRIAMLFAALSGIFLALDLALWHESIHAIGPGISTLLNSLQIFFLAGIGIVFFAERLTLIQLCSLLLAITGVAMIGSPEFRHNDNAAWGFTSGIISGLMFAAAMASIRKTHDIEITNLIALMLISSAAGALAILPLGLIIDHGHFVPIGWQDIALVIVYGTVMQCVAWGLVAFSIPKLSLALTGLIMLSEPVAALVIDYLLLDKPINALQWFGAFVTLTAIYIGSIVRRP